MNRTSDADLRNQVIAFAGLLQSAVLVDKLATTGQWHEASFETCIYSIFQQNPATTEAVYGDTSSLYIGLTTLRNLLNPKERGKLQAVFRYGFSLLRLERQLSRQKKILNTIGDEIQQLSTHTEDLPMTDPFVTEQLSNLYRKTAGTLTPPIQVMGDQQTLQRTSVQQQVRALLLAGLRSAILWRQVGGRIWRFALMPKRRVIKIIDQLLQPVH